MNNIKADLSSSIKNQTTKVRSPLRLNLDLETTKRSWSADLRPRKNIRLMEIRDDWWCQTAQGFKNKY